MTKDSRRYTVPTVGPLSDEQIHALCRDHGMIEPYWCDLVEDGAVSYGLSSMGYDIRAGLDWKVFVAESETQLEVIDPKHPSIGYFRDVSVQAGERVVIPPNGYALTHSLERVRMPDNVIGLCVGKSTYARCGIHVNVTPIEPVWEGQITIEISNGTRMPVAVYAGEGIMQLVFFAGPIPRVTYGSRKGKYQGQTGVTLAKVIT